MLYTPNAPHRWVLSPLQAMEHLPSGRWGNLGPPNSSPQEQRLGKEPAGARTECRHQVTTEEWTNLALSNSSNYGARPFKSLGVHPLYSKGSVRHPWLCAVVRWWYNVPKTYHALLG